MKRRGIKRGRKDAAVIKTFQHFRVAPRRMRCARHIARLGEEKFI
jgi:hypothetical protein